MAKGENNASVTTRLKNKFIHSPVKCERCLGGDKVEYYVQSDIIHVGACKACADEARRLGLTVVSIGSDQHAA